MHLGTGEEDQDQRERLKRLLWMAEFFRRLGHEKGAEYFENRVLFCDRGSADRGRT